MGFATFAAVQQHGQRLNGFAQAHVVGQAAAEMVVLHEAQPVVAGLLVGAQLALEADGQRVVLHFGKVAELGQLAAHAYGGQLIALQVGYQCQVMAAQVEAVGRFFAKGKQLQVVRKPLFGDDGNLAIR